MGGFAVFSIFGYTSAHSWLLTLRSVAHSTYVTLF